MRTRDGYIIHKCLNGEPEAFGLLVDKYKASIYALAYTKLQNFQDAEDITQEVFIKAYQNLHRLKYWDSFFAWLYSITTNLCKNWIQEQARRPDHGFIRDQSPKTLEGLSMDFHRESMLHKSLHEALDSLPDIYRQVLILYYFGDMNSYEIARFLGASPTAIRQRLSRARAHLREEMVAMMSTSFEGQKLQADFTFRIVEAVKRVKIQPAPRTTGLPWGLSLATGIILAVMGISPYLSLINPMTVPTGLLLPSEMRGSKTGEIPVDVLKISEISSAGGQQRNGDGAPLDPQNAFLLAPAGEGDDEEEVEKLFDDYVTAWETADFELMKKLWSHENDVRYVSTVPPGRSVEVPLGWNPDYRGWDDILEHHFDVIFNTMNVTGKLEDAVMQIQGDKACVTVDGVVWGIPYKGSVVSFRKEGDEWRVYMDDADGWVTTRSGDESGGYVEIASEAEDGAGEKSLHESADASGGIYVISQDLFTLEFNVPEAGEYAVWCRTRALLWPASYYTVKVDDIEFRGWAAVCTEWTWSLLNEEGIKGPKLFKLNTGKHALSLGSPHVISGLGKTLGDCQFDAVYITGNLNLRHDQIQRRFEMTMGYSEESKAAATQEKAITTWARIKRKHSKIRE